MSNFVKFFLVFVMIFLVALLIVIAVYCSSQARLDRDIFENQRYDDMSFFEKIGKERPK